MSEQRPERGGAWDFDGVMTPEYGPDRNGEPDPGEVVWTWVPYEEDPHQGKDRPLVIVGRDSTDRHILVGLMLSSRDHDGDPHWHAIGAGGWDGEHRPSWVRVDRPLAVRPDSVRREGSALRPEVFLAVVEHAASIPDSERGAWRRAPSGRRRVTRLIGVYRAPTGPLGRVAFALGRLTGRPPTDLPDAHRSARRRKATWDSLTLALPVPFDLVHYAQASGRIQSLVPSRDAAPAVLAEVGGRVEVILTRAEIEPLAGNVSAFGAALKDALVRHDLTLR